MNNDNFRRVVVGRGEGDRALLHSAHSLDALELVLLPASHGAGLRSLHFEVHQAYEDVDEAYTLEIPGQEAGTVAAPIGESRFAKLSATSSLGLLRGLQTFVQLVYSLPAGSGSELSTASPP